MRHIQVVDKNNTKFFALFGSKVTLSPSRVDFAFDKALERVCGCLARKGSLKISVVFSEVGSVDFIDEIDCFSGSGWPS